MFIRNEPAMKIGHSLVISDLHIGIEDELSKNGIKISDQTKALLKRICFLIRETKARETIILGDIKNSIFTTKIENKKISEFLDSLKKVTNLVLVKGNHDGLIEKLVKKDVDVCSFDTRGSYLLTHGHRKIPKNLKEKNEIKTIVIGHNHPGICFKDRYGIVSTEPCWVVGTEKEKRQVIIMPAFNPLVGETAINRHDVMGPIAKNIDIENARIYLLDGTYLGHVKTLR